ncbi:hypothetical protein BVIET440_160016 [Burkholderia vietnamiensis]|nr:hypothetical protein BVI434_2650004 [Burkholderia vietnamiensis]
MSNSPRRSTAVRISGHAAFRRPLRANSAASRSAPSHPSRRTRVAVQLAMPARAERTSDHRTAHLRATHRQPSNAFAPTHGNAAFSATSSAVAALADPVAQRHPCGPQTLDAPQVPSTPVMTLLSFTGPASDYDPINADREVLIPHGASR